MKSMPWKSGEQGLWESVKENKCELIPVIGLFIWFRNERRTDRNYKRNGDDRSNNAELNALDRLPFALFSTALFMGLLWFLYLLYKG
jgi:hypothetical protein